MTTPIKVVRLVGDAQTRARLQIEAAGGAADAVRTAMRGRLRDAAAMRAREDVARYLADMDAMLASRSPAAKRELAGLAEGYGLGYDELFDALHLAVVTDHCAVAGAAGDGCTAWATKDTEGRPILGKNRDFGGNWPLPSAIFDMSELEWGPRRVLCVGSFGAPGAYSSGVNDAGLALADTQIGALDHGVGLLRYFVMTEILAACDDVEAALRRLRELPHCGGGSLVLADRSGAAAAVELGHRQIAVDRGTASGVARTNHFVAPELAHSTRDSVEGRANSVGRLATIRAWLDAGGIGEASARAMMGGHDSAKIVGLCRHGGVADSLTLSGSIFRPDAVAFSHANGNPCLASWTSYRLHASDRPGGRTPPKG